VPQSGGPLGVVRLLRDDDPHLHPPAGGRQDPLDGVAVREVGVHHVELLARSVDLLADRLRGRDKAAGDHLSERDRCRAALGRLGEERRQVGRERPAVAVEAAPVELLVVWEEAIPVGQEHVVDDDLRSRRCEAREHLARLAIRPRPESVHDHPHLDAVRQLLLEECSHPHTHLALPPAEHEDVNGRTRGLDVREDARKEVRALDPGLDRRRRRPREVERRIARARPSLRSEGLRRDLRACRCHRVRRRRPARALRDPKHPPMHDPESRPSQAADHD
jgi:hypothetical protein